jgi:hypothetical protein
LANVCLVVDYLCILGRLIGCVVLSHLGFETFDSILDETYDTLDIIDVERYAAAFDQVQWLSKQNHPALLQKVKPILDHNHDRLFRFKLDIEAQ